jgi:N-methylhydantoinase B/oxoprolinase/acetone carboxylase alpha subunit
LRRDPQKVLADVLDGVVSVERAREEYAVVIDPADRKIDDEATHCLRSAGR